MELKDFLEIEDLKTLKKSVEEHLGIKLHPNTGMKTVLKAVQCHYMDVEEEQIGSDDGLVRVIGCTMNYVGTGMPGAQNKLHYGEEMVLPVILATQLIKAGQAKEIK